MCVHGVYASPWSCKRSQSISAIPLILTCHKNKKRNKKQQRNKKQTKVKEMCCVARKNKKIPWKRNKMMNTKIRRWKWKKRKKKIEEQKKKR